MCVIESGNWFQSATDGRERRKIRWSSDPQSAFDPSSRKVLNELRHETSENTRSIELVSALLFPRIANHTKSTCSNSNSFPVITELYRVMNSLTPGVDDFSVCTTRLGHNNGTRGFWTTFVVNGRLNCTKFGAIQLRPSSKHWKRFLWRWIIGNIHNNGSIMNKSWHASTLSVD
jgi:hypothetical protein